MVGKGYMMTIKLQYDESLGGMGHLWSIAIIHWHCLLSLSQSVHRLCYHVEHGSMVVVKERASYAIGNDEAYGECMVIHECRKSIDGRGFHFEVSHTEVVPTKRSKTGCEVWYARSKAHIASLWPIETGGCGCDALIAVSAYTLQQVEATGGSIGLCHTVGEHHVVDERVCQIRLQKRRRMLVIVNKAIEANRIARCYDRACWQVGLQTTACTHTHETQGAMR